MQFHSTQVFDRSRFSVPCIGRPGDGAASDVLGRGACVPVRGLCDRKSIIIPGTIRDGMLRCDGSAVVRAGLPERAAGCFEAPCAGERTSCGGASAFGLEYRVASSCAHALFFRMRRAAGRRASIGGCRLQGARRMTCCDRLCDASGLCALQSWVACSRPRPFRTRRSSPCP